MKQRFLELYNKYQSLICIWGCGIVGLCVVHYTSEKSPEFVEEYEIVTWAEVKSNFIILWCLFMTYTNRSDDKPFWSCAQNKWVAGLKKTVEQQEEQITSMTESVHNLKTDLQYYASELEKLNRKHSLQASLSTPWFNQYDEVFESEYYETCCQFDTCPCYERFKNNVRAKMAALLLEHGIKNPVVLDNICTDAERRWEVMNSEE